MGSCLTKCHGRQQEQPDDRYESGGAKASGDHQDNEFDEDVRKKSRHRADGGGDHEWRRKSSGLSRYSQDGRHVIHPPCCIGAFNIQKFGMAKLSDKETLDTIARLVREFDILLVQEVVDVSGKALNLLLEEVNNGQQDEGMYEVLASPRVGRSAHKEQYAIFYKVSLVQIKDSKLYHDPGDLFIREPFIVSVSVDTVSSVASQFCLICIHTQPTSANLEIDGLVDVQKHVTNTWQMDNIIILGDLNASGQYIKSRDWDTNRLRGAEYNWLIPDHVDTTTTNTLAAYDRIIVRGPMMDAIVPDSAQVFRYDQVYKLSLDSLKKVSDHYPVRFSLQTLAHPKIQKNI
jgi:deoxyribonuclease-1-like protein